MADDLLKPVIEEIPEPPVKEEPPVEVSLEKSAQKPEDEQRSDKMRADFEALYGGRMKQLENGYQAIQRINTKLQSELEAVKKATPLSADISAQSSRQPTDPWAGIENGQVWKEAISKLAQEEAKRLFEQQQTLTAQQQQLAAEDSIREGWKQKVVEEFPDLGPEGDATSEVSTTFNKILNEHPEYLRNPYGPRLAMLDLKEQLQSTGKLDSAKESARKSRANLSALPASRPMATGNKIVISKEQADFYKWNKVSPELYAKTAQALEKGEEITA